MGSKKKLAFTTFGCQDWPFAKVLDLAGKLGFSGIEIRGLEGNNNIDDIPHFLPENKTATLAALKAHSLAICNFGSSVRFDDAEKFDAMISEGKRAIDVCQFMGIPAIRIFGDRLSPGEDESVLIDRVAKGAGILAEYGEAKGVVVMLESHGDFNTLERIKGVFDQVKSFNFRLLWDVGHTYRAYKENHQEFYEAMKDKISHIHVRDIILTPGEKKNYVPNLIGKGHVPIKDIVRQLLSDGYDGFFSIEWEKKGFPELPDPETAFAEFVRFMNEI